MVNLSINSYHFSKRRMLSTRAGATKRMDSRFWKHGAKNWRQSFQRWTTWSRVPTACSTLRRRQVCACRVPQMESVRESKTLLPWSACVCVIWMVAREVSHLWTHAGLSGVSRLRTRAGFSQEHLHANTRRHTHTHTQTHTHTHTHTHVHTNAHTYANAQTHKHKHTHTQTISHSHTHTNV